MPGRSRFISCSIYRVNVVIQHNTQHHLKLMVQHRGHASHLSFDATNRAKKRPKFISFFAMNWLPHHSVAEKKKNSLMVWEAVTRRVTRGVHIYTCRSRQEVGFY
jgi:hypothetical protein